jgi:iron complex transport system substrate-binding protein
MYRTDARKRRWCAVVAGIVAIATAGCSSGDDETDPVTAGGQEESPAWSFTDDRGVEVKRDQRPTRVVAYETAAAALWHQGIEPVAIFGGGRLSADNPNLAGVDINKMQSAGEVYGEVNLEKLAALRPDLIVTAYDPRQTGPVFGFTEQSQVDKVQAVAPIVAINGIKDPVEVISRFGQLAQSLGADPKMARVTDARRRFEAARHELKAAIAAKPGLKVLATYATPAEGASIARPETFPGLRQLAQLGLDIVEPGGERVDSPSADFVKFFWETLSMEQVGKYPVDMIMLDSDLGQAGRDELMKVGTWKALPAVKAGQIVGFRKLENWSYQAYAGDFEELTAAIKAARADLVL